MLLGHTIALRQKLAHISLKSNVASSTELQDFSCCYFHAFSFLLSQALAEQQKAQQLSQQQQAASAVQPQGAAAQPQASAAGAQVAGVPQPGAAAVPNTAVLVRALKLHIN